jgi:phosphopantothenoylcysteine decarboxylase/phosphopantothenate--cysteine ligase
MKAPVFIAPAMDLDMYAHPSTQRNVELLKGYGNHIIEAASGELASHLCGKGRLEEPEAIVERIKDFFLGSSVLAGKKVLVTAGPTYEKIDPVRFIGNYSTGKMGFAIAEECAAQGAEVTLVAGPVSLECKHPGIKRVDVESAREMYDAAMDAFPACDVAVLSAAVADYRPAQYAPVKMKRTADDMFIELTPNSDIAASLGSVKGENQMLVGFALETNNAEENARLKSPSLKMPSSLPDPSATSAEPDWALVIAMTASMIVAEGGTIAKRSPVRIISPTLRTSERPIAPAGWFMA